MEHEDTLNILFGEETGAKSDLEKLKAEIDYERLPDSMKDTITNNKTDVAEISVENVEEVEDTISSHNSVRVAEESAITNNSSRIDEETHITNNADDIHEHDEVEGKISSHNFENQ